MRGIRPNAPEMVLVELSSRRHGKRLKAAQQAIRQGTGVVYHAGEANRCPSCHGQSWNVGRTMAQCAGCDTALPIITDGREA